MSQVKDKTIKQSAILKSLKIASVYSFIFLILVVWFREPIFKTLDIFLSQKELYLYPKLYLGVFLSFSLCHFINAFSWMVLLQSKDEYHYVKKLNGTVVYSMLINMLPIGTGHMLGIWYFNKCSKVSVKKLLFGWTIDQYTRGVVKVLFLIVFLNMAEPFGDIGKKLTEALTYFGCLIGVSALILPFVKNSSKLKAIWEKFCHKFDLHEETTSDKKWLNTFFYACALRMLCWIFEVLPVWMLCYVLLSDFSLDFVFALFLSVKVATAYSFSPGNFGVHEAVTYFVATAYGVDKDTALSLGVLYHLGFWLPTVLPGGIVVLVLFLRKAFSKT